MKRLIALLLVLALLFADVVPAVQASGLAETEPAVIEQVETEPAETEPAETEPAATEPAATEPAATEPAETEPAATEPAQTEAALSFYEQLLAAATLEELCALLESGAAEVLAQAELTAVKVRAEELLAAIEAPTDAELQCYDRIMAILDALIVGEEPTEAPAEETTEAPAPTEIPEATEDAGVTEMVGTEPADEAAMAAVDGVLTTPIDTTEFTADASGEGWVWNHSAKTLTITNLKLHSDDWYGIILGEGHTLVSSGTRNEIVAEDGIDFYGNATITGSAELVIKADWCLYADDHYTMTIDGTPMTLEAVDYAISPCGESLDRALVLNGGAYIATAGVEFVEEYGHNWYYSNVLNIEIKVAEPYIDLTTMPAAKLAGKANDDTFSQTITAGAEASTGETVTYQWYTCDDFDRTNPVAIDGATAASYTFSGSHDAGDYYFFCKATAGSLSRDLPATRVTLNPAGIMPVDTIGIYSYTGDTDRLDTEGWAWDVDNLTLTLKNAYVREHIYINVDGNGGVVTIQLAEGSVNNVALTVTDKSYALNVTSRASGLVITGAGTLNLGMTNDSTNSSGNVLYNQNDSLVISGGAQVNVKVNGTGRPVYGESLQVKDTAKLTTENVTASRPADSIYYAAGSYMKLVRTVITTPATYTTEVKSGYTYIKDESGYVAKVVYEASTETCVDFTKYPKTSYTLTEPGTVTLSAEAEAYNYTGSEAITYQWYKDGTAIEGATGKDYTVTVTEKSLHKYHCVASLEGDAYTVTGATITVNYGIKSTALSLSSSTVTEDRIATEGWAWNAETRTLTLDGIYIHTNYSALTFYSSLEDATIVLAEGSENLLVSDTQNGLVANTDVTITGTGKLTALSYGTGSTGALDVESSSTLTITGGAQVEGIKEQSLGLWMESGCKLRILGANTKLYLKGKDQAMATRYEPVPPDFVIESPAGGSFVKSGSSYTIRDAHGNLAKEVTLVADTVPKLIFTTAPAASYTLGKGESVTLNAEAEARNMPDGTKVTCRWIQDGKEVATGNSYTVSTKESGIFAISCEVSATVDGTKYTATTSTTVNIGVVTERLYLVGSSSHDKLSDYGYKWDLNTKTLTLDGFYTTNYVQVPDGSTIVLAEGSTNVFDIKNNPAIYGGNPLTITGGGKLVIHHNAPAYNAISASKLHLKGVDIEIYHTNSIGNSIPVIKSTNLGSIDASRIYIKEIGGKKDNKMVTRLTLADNMKITTGTTDSAGDGYIGVMSEDGTYTELLLETKDWYISSSPDEITPASMGKAVKLSVGLTTKKTVKAKYQWYTTADPAVTDLSAEGVAKVAKGTAATLSVTPKSRGVLGYYFCTVTVNGVTMTTPVTTVVAGAKGKLPVIGSIETPLDQSIDKMSTEGWAWDHTTLTLTLNDVEQYEKTNALKIYAGTTIVLQKGSVNNLGIGSAKLMLRANGSETGLTITGAGTLNLPDYDFTINADMVINGGATVNSTRISEPNEVLNLTVENARLNATGNTSRIHGDITVGSGGEVYMTSIYKYTSRPITVKSGGLLELTEGLVTYGNLAVEEGARMLVDSNITIGSTSDPKPVQLTVGGTLYIDRNVDVYTTLTENGILLTGSAKFLKPEGGAVKMAAQSGYNQFYVGSSGSYAYGVLIADDSFEYIPVTAVGNITGTPAYGETIKAGAVTPADADVDFRWQYASSKEGPWYTWSQGSPGDLTIPAKMTDMYIRLVVEGEGIYTGQVVSNILGPVKGEPGSLKGLYMDDSTVGSYPFDGDNLTRSASVYLFGPKTVTITAVPVSEDADISIKLTNATYPDGITTEGRVAEVPVALGENKVEISVTYGGNTKVYTLDIGGYEDRRDFNLYNYADDVTVYAELTYANGTVETYSAIYGGSNYHIYVEDVPADTRIKLTSSAPVGKQVVTYDRVLMADLTQPDSPVEYVFSDYPYSISFRSSYVAGVAPKELKVQWNANEENSAWIEASALETDTPYEYFSICMEILDENGEMVQKINSVQEGWGVNTENMYAGFVSGLDSSRNYTVRAYYPDLTYSSSEYGITTVELKAMGEVTLTPEKEYLVLKPGQTEVIAFTFDAYAFSSISLEENTDPNVADVWFDGNKMEVTAGSKEGTAWLTVAGFVRRVNVPGGGTKDVKVYSQIRVDVSGSEDPAKLHLGVTTGTLNVYDDSAVTVPVHQMDCGYEILGAEFADAKANEKLQIRVVDDRTLEITPKVSKPADQTWTAWANSMKGSITSKIKVIYRDEVNNIHRVSEESIKITLTAKAPSVKAAAVKFNSFYYDNVQELKLTTANGTVSHVQPDATKESAQWAVPDGMSLRLDNSKLTAKSASGKVYLEVWLEGWRAPALVTVSASVSYTAPKLKLSAATITIPANTDSFDRAYLSLVSSDKKVSVADLNVTDIRVISSARLAALSAKDRQTYAASTAYRTTNPNYETGTFEVYDYSSVVAGKVLILVTIGGDSRQVVQLPLTVKLAAAATVKASTTSISLNPALGTVSADVDLIPSLSGYKITNSNTTLAVKDSKGNDCASELDISQSYETITIKTNASTRDTTYKITATVDGIAKPATITVKVKTAKPTVKLSKSSITLNRSKPGYDGNQSVVVTLSDSKFPLDTSNCTYKILDSNGNVVENVLSVSRSYENNRITMEIYPSYYYSLTEVGTYTVRIDVKLPNGETVSKNLTVKLVDTKPSVKLGASAVSLYSELYNYDVATVAIKGLEDYCSVNSYNCEVKDSKGKIANNIVMVNGLSSDHLQLRMYSGAPAGTYNMTLKIKLTSGLELSPVKLKINIVKNVTGSATVKNSILLTDPLNSSADFNLKFSGWNPGQYSGTAAPVLSWEVYAKDGKKNVTSAQGALNDEGLVAYGESGNDYATGWFKNMVDPDENRYGLALGVNKGFGNVWQDGLINPKFTYTCQIKLTFPGENTKSGEDKVVTFKPVKFTVNQGTAKFSVSPTTTTLSVLDADSRQLFTLINTDKAANSMPAIAHVELTNSALADKLEIVKIGYDSDTFAIRWKDNTPASVKSGTVKVNIYLEGNDPARKVPNATVTLKVNIQ